MMAALTYSQLRAIPEDKRTKGQRTALTRIVNRIKAKQRAGAQRMWERRHAEQTGQTPASTTIKRGPGRPRKNSVAHVVAVQPKRGPGRPRKDSVAVAPGLLTVSGDAKRQTVTFDPTAYMVQIVALTAGGKKAATAATTAAAPAVKTDTGLSRGKKAWLTRRRNAAASQSKTVATRAKRAETMASRRAGKPTTTEQRRTGMQTRKPGRTLGPRSAAGIETPPAAPAPVPQPAAPAPAPTPEVITSAAPPPAPAPAPQPAASPAPVPAQTEAAPAPAVTEHGDRGPTEHRELTREPTREHPDHPAHAG